MLTGQQKSFSWQAVAASAIAAPITSEIDQAFGTSSIQGQSRANMPAMIASEFLKGATREAANVLVNRGGRMEWRNIAVSAFGNALGESIENGLRDSARQGVLANEVASAPGRSVHKDSYWGETASNFGKTDSKVIDGPLRDLYDLSNKSNMGDYLNSVNQQRMNGIQLEPEDIATSKAVLFHYYGYPMGEDHGASAQMAGNLNDQDSKRLQTHLEHLAKHPPMNRIIDMTSIATFKQGSAESVT